MCTFLCFPFTVHCDSRVQSSQETVHACPGEIVIIPCTIPTRTQQWRAPDLDIARSLAAADLNEAVPPDRPFQFAVTNVTLNGSIISTATVNFTGSLNGTIVSCRDGYLIFPNEQRTMLKLKGKENVTDYMQCTCNRIPSSRPLPLSLVGMAI